MGILECDMSVLNCCIGGAYYCSFPGSVDRARSVISVLSTYSFRERILMRSVWILCLFMSSCRLERIFFSSSRWRGVKSLLM